jgi:hypothetical protein
MKLIDVLFIIGLISILVSGSITTYVYYTNMNMIELNPVFSSIMQSQNHTLWLFVIAFRLFVFLSVSMYVRHYEKQNEFFASWVYTAFIFMLIYDAFNDVYEFLRWGV